MRNLVIAGGMVELGLGLLFWSTQWYVMGTILIALGVIDIALALGAMDD